MPGKNWQGQLDLLKEQLAAGIPLSEVQIPGRNPNAIRAKAVREGLIEAGPADKNWEDNELQTLQEVAGPGVGAASVKADGKLEGRSPNAIAKRKSRLGLVDARRSASIQQATWLEGNQLEEVLADLRKDALTRPTEWFIWRWGISRGTVKRLLEKIGLTVGRREVLQMPSSIAKRSRSSTLALAQLWEGRRRKLYERMRAEKKLLDEQRSKPKIKKCSRCSSEWYKTPRFFAVRKKIRGKILLRTYFSKNCLHCLSRANSLRDEARIVVNTARRTSENLVQFACELAKAYPTLYQTTEPPKLKKRFPFTAVLGASDMPSLAAIVAQVLQIYSRTKLDQCLIWLDGSDFGDSPGLRQAVLDLQQLSLDSLKSEVLYQKEGLTPEGEKIALLLFRVFGLAEYALLLV